MATVTEPRGFVAADVPPPLAWAPPFGIEREAAGLLPEANQPATSRRLALEVALFIGLAVVLVLFIRTFIVEVRYIPSGSMLDQLHINDRVAVSKISYRLHDPRRGDIVVFEPPEGEGAVPAGDARPLPLRWLRALGEGLALVHPSTDDFIKRVIALPGETVEGRDGSVWVDGRRLVEPYLDPGMTTGDFPAQQVPDGSVWVMGDNRPNSSDSRYIGPIPNDRIVGRAVVRIWPLPRASFL